MNEVLEKQIYGCFAYNDTLEEVKKSLSKVTGMCVREIRQDKVMDKPCFILEYNVYTKHAKIMPFDDLTTRIHKVVDNLMDGYGMAFIYIDELTKMRKNIPYIERKEYAEV